MDSQTVSCSWVVVAVSTFTEHVCLEMALVVVSLSCSQEAVLLGQGWSAPGLSATVSREQDSCKMFDCRQTLKCWENYILISSPTTVHLSRVIVPCSGTDRSIADWFISLSSDLVTCDGPAPNEVSLSLSLCLLSSQRHCFQGHSPKDPVRDQRPISKYGQPNCELFVGCCCSEHFHRTLLSWGGFCRQSLSQEAVLLDTKEGWMISAWFVN